VLGVGRGGTTLLANCIDAHPRARCFNETGDDLLRGKDHPVYSVLRPMARLPGVSRVAARLENLADDWLARPMQNGGMSPAGLRRMLKFYGVVHPMLAGQVEPAVGDKIVVESLAMTYRRPYRSNEHPGDDRHAAARQETLRHFCNRLFSAYHVIFIVRDGRSSLQSRMTRSHDSLLEAAAHWLEAARVHRALAGLLGRRLVTVKFEQLVAEPAAVLRHVGEFLSIGYEPQMLSGASRKYGNEARHGFERQRIRRDPAPHFVGLIREGLEYFEYPVEARDPGD
jgi:hypothetical protein